MTLVSPSNIHPLQPQMWQRPGCTFLASKGEGNLTIIIGFVSAIKGVRGVTSVAGVAEDIENSKMDEFDVVGGYDGHE